MKAGGRKSSGEGLTPMRAPAVKGELVVRVRYCECDPMGVAHHAAYVAWLEMGRTELLRVSGVSYADLESAGVFLVVARLEVRYRAPGRYDDELMVETALTGGGRARLDHAYEVWRYERGGAGRAALLATATSTLACVDAEGRVRALPGWLVWPGEGAATPRAT